MASFSDLSNELVLLILDRVFPGDLVSFCLISKHVHHLSADKLTRHRVMTQQNRRFHNYSKDGLQEYCHRADQLPELLCRVLRDPLVGHYVKWMDFDLWFSHRWLTSSGHNTYPKEQMSTFETAIRSANLPLQYQEIWLWALTRCDGDTIVALLLLHTPNLERLDIRHLESGCPHRSNSFPASIATLAHLASKATFVDPCLQRLKRVTLHLGDGRNPLPLAKTFMSLPSVTSLTVSSISNGETIQYPIEECLRLPVASSNVADMHLSGQFTDRAELTEILNGCKNLAHLTVEFFTYSPRHIRQMFFSDVIAILKISAEHSLKSLKSRAFLLEKYDSDDKGENSYDERDLIDCTAFKTLRQIDVEAQMLLRPQDKYKLEAVVDRLPHSLQHLYLTYSFEHNLPYERDSLRALENPKLAQLPNLRLLQVHTHSTSRARRIANSLSGGDTRFGLDYIVCGGDFQKICNAVDSGDDEDT